MPDKSTSTGSVFVSYAHDDLDRVCKLLDTLTGAGFKVWWDDDLTIGRSFRADIDAALDAASCLIVVWTQLSVTRAWVLDEVTRVKDKGIVLPVVLDKDLKIPLGFGQMEHAKLEGWTGGDHPELSKLLGRVRDLVALGPSMQYMPTLASDIKGTIPFSVSIVSRMQALTSEVRHIGDVFASDSAATTDLRGALEEVGKTYRVVNSAILRFKKSAAQQPIQVEPFLELEGSDLRSEIANGRGHCHLIDTHYGRNGGLREFLDQKVREGKLTPSDFNAIDHAFNQLSRGDNDLFEPLEAIGELLANESRAVASLLLAGQEPLARQRIIDGRAKLQPLEDDLSKAILELQQIESSLGYVRRVT